MMATSRMDDLEFAREVIRAECRALEDLAAGLGASFNAAVEMLLACRGRVALTGVGKAGLIGQKISATLASTGTPSYSLHPVEALHGDLGRIMEEDVALVLSNSGETEVIHLLGPVKRIGARVIAVTGNAQSTLGQHADVVLDVGAIAEADPLGLAPSASTTAMLALGDALALTVARRRNFDKETYALYHPGGELGRKLMRVEEVMRGPEECALVGEDTVVREALKKSPSRAGALCVLDGEKRFVGIFTDGDLRRRLTEGVEFLEGPVSAVMTANPKRIDPGSLAQEAAKIMDDYHIDELPVVDGDGRLRGVVDVQDLLAVRLLSP